MTNAKTTTRRAALGAVLAAAALGAPALAMAPAAAAPLSPVDRRVTDLWLRRRRLMAIADRWSKQSDAAQASLPEWARSGPVYVMPDGTPAGKAQAGWPVVADLSRRPVLPSGAVNVRPNWQDVVSEWRDVGGEDVDLAQALAEWGSRVLEQAKLKVHFGISKLTSAMSALGTRSATSSTISCCASARRNSPRWPPS